MMPVDGPAALRSEIRQRAPGEKITFDLARCRRRTWIGLLVLVALSALGAALSENRPFFGAIWGPLVANTAIVAILWALQSRKLLTVSPDAVSYASPLESWVLSPSRTERLVHFPGVRATGLAGVYIVETADGEVGRFVVRRPDAGSAEVRELLVTVAEVCGRPWEGFPTGGSGSSSSFRDFLLEVRQASGAPTGRRFLLWLVRASTLVRGEVGSLSGASFRWAMMLFAAAFLSFVLVVFRPRFYAEGLNLGFSTGPPQAEATPRSADRATGSGVARQTSRKAHLSDTVAQLLAALGWACTCLGANSLLGLLRLQSRRRRKLEGELTAARRVQERLLPLGAPAFAGLDLAGVCRPALDVGGDYFDYVTLPGGDLAVAVADVSGKGLGAGLLMTLTKGCLTTSLEAGAPVVEALGALNRRITLSAHDRMFVTMAVARVSAGAAAVEVVRAGHNPPLLLRAGHEPEWLVPPGLALGLTKGPLFSSICRPLGLSLAPGDVLILYSDGVTEAMDPEGNEYGEARFAATVVSVRGAPAKEILAAVLSDVASFRRGAPPNDDLTLVVLRRTSASTPSSVATACVAVRE